MELSPAGAGFDEYEWPMNPPRVRVDNTSSETATLIEVDSSNRHGILLQVVQIIVDLELIVRKAHLSSVGGRIMDVFHVTDDFGNKVADPQAIAQIEESIGSSCEILGQQLGVHPSSEHTAIELTGTDRPGLLSEISALLTDVGCNVITAKLWTHNKRVACLIYVTEEATGGPIYDHDKLLRNKKSLCNLLQGDKDSKGARADFTTSVFHTERRLHQMMFADRDYERIDDKWDQNGKITVEDCDEKGYSVVHIECKNRHKLVFDTVCTLTDMQYVVFHATIDTDGPRAYQEYYIRHLDGRTLNSQAERRRLIQCLRAAIERRVCEGLRLEMCTSDRVGLLADVTRIFREHGLCITSAEVSTKNSKAFNVFYVTDTLGNQVAAKLIDALRREIGQTILRATEEPLYSISRSAEVQESRSKFCLGSLLGKPTQMLYSLGLIKSWS